MLTRLSNIQPVTDLLYKKTEGNPFFLAMFLRALHDEGLVRLSSDGSQWDFDLPAIAKRPATENVIEFTVSRMSQFDNDVLSILKWCSCLGNSFNLSKLQFVTKRSHEDLMETLFPLLNHGLVSVVDNIFRFEHDRVQEAATGLLSEEDKHRTHFQIGMTMLEGLLKADTVLDADTEVKMDDFACEAQEVCEIAEQLNAARTIVVAEAPHLIVFLFRMNILLGKRAIDTVAYSSAVTSLLHAEFFFSQLGEKEGWKKYHNTAFELFKSQAAVYAMRAEYELSDAVMDKILNHEPTLAERGIIYNMKIMKETQLFRLEEALAIGVIALGYFGISLPTDPKESDLLVEQEMEKIEKRMVELRGPHPNPNSDFSYLTDETLYEPTTPENRTLQPLLATLQLTTYLSDAVRFKLVTAINCNLCLRVKPIAELSTAFCFLAVRMATEKKYLTALEFKNIAYYLVNVVYPKNLAIRCQALHLGSIFIDFWFNHVRDSEMAEQQAHDFGIESGEIPYAGYTYSYLVPSMEYRGDTIPQMLPEISRCYRFTVDTQNVGVRGHIEAVRLMLHYFIGSDYEHHESIGVIEQEYMEKWALASNYYALAHWSVRKLQFEFTTKYIYLDPKEIENVEEFVASQLSRLADCENQLQYIMSHYANTIFYLYDTLLCIRLLRLLQSTPDTQNLSGTCLDRIENGMSSFEIWSKNNPINFSNKYFLLKAEYTYYIENHHWKAINYYDDSLKAASDSGFLHEYALTKELTSILFIKEDKPSIAKTYIKKAYMAYRKWGATLKLEILQDKYYDYLESLIAKGSPNTPGRTTNSTTLTTVSNFNSDRNRSKSSNTSSTVNVQLALLDMESVVRANQIISSTIDMDELLFNIMRVIIETAGATSGAIITENEVVAQYKKVDNTTEDSQKQTTVAPNHIITNISIPLRNWKDGCIPVVQYVTKTLSTVVMGNAMKDDEYAFIQADEYVFKNQVKSLLCMPVMHQNELKAILYVENSLATDCFTSERVNVLAILTSQMAISIQNSRSFKEQLKIQQVAEFQRGRAQEADLYRQKQEEFIDRICHEIRNPIQGIMGNCDMMRVNMDELKQLVHQQSYQECIEKLDSLDSFVEAVVICAKYQKVITDDVLTLSKLEFGKVALNALAFSPIALLDSLMHMFEAEIHKKKLTLEKIIDCKEDVVLSGDTMRISQILINLLSNSIKFTSTGGIKVYMDYSLIKDEAQVTVPELKFTVEDSGCGMDEQDTAHLFNRFEQAQRTQSEYGGSGLGLFICKQLVLLMGGQIYVESVKGMGSRFTFTVKCSTPDEKQLREFLNGKSNTPVGEDGEKFLRTIDVNGVRPLNVLVVEDNKINHRVLVSMLQKAGCNCAGAYNGVEGLSMYKEQSFDLVFMDVTMPQMNGYECTSAIREYELEMGLPETPIIGLSGNVRTEYMNMGLEAGMTAYMNKPVKYTEILQKVEQCKRK
jgi:signal transduction histidine kinase/CheY-like chemotaxis protein